MFGHNQIVGRKFFQEAPDDRLLVTSIFLTLQGEGPFAGRPAMFIRLAKCNLACSFCDTYFDTGDWMDVGEIVTTMRATIKRRYGDDHPPRVGVVITGGEPSLQSRGLRALIGMLADQDVAFIQIESNGILPVDYGYQGSCLVVSPKCVEAVGSRKPLGYVHPHETVMRIANCLKFVVSADPDSSYHLIPQWAHDWAKENRRYIYISPMNVYLREPLLASLMRGGHKPSIEDRNAGEVVSFWDPGLLDMERNRANHQWAGEYALNHGYFVSLQMHLMLGMA